MRPYLEIGSLQMSLAKMQSYWSRASLKSNGWCPYEKATWRPRDTQRKEGHVTMEQRLE